MDLQAICDAYLPNFSLKEEMTKGFIDTTSVKRSRRYTVHYYVFYSLEKKVKNLTFHHDLSHFALYIFAVDKHTTLVRGVTSTKVLN